MLPHKFPSWQTVYHYFRLWRLYGIWERINAALRTELKIANGREPESSAAILDSQSVKTTETPGVRGYDAGKKVKGRKRHILVDTTGLLLMVVMVVVHAANIQDRDGAKLVLEQIKGKFSRLQLIWADAAYAGQLVNWLYLLALSSELFSIVDNNFLLNLYEIEFTTVVTYKEGLTNFKKALMKQTNQK